MSWFLSFLVSWLLSFLVSWFCWIIGFPASWFLSLLVSKLLGFLFVCLVSWFQSFLVAWFLGFAVPWFLSFVVSGFLGFLVSWFQDFRVPKIQESISCFWEIIPHYQHSISCLVEDIDPIFRFVWEFIKRIVGVFSAHPFRNSPTHGFPKTEMWRILFSNMIGDFFGINQSVLVSPKINNIGFGVIDTSENTEIMEMRRFRFLP